MQRSLRRLAVKNDDAVVHIICLFYLVLICIAYIFKYDNSFNASVFNEVLRNLCNEAKIAAKRSTSANRKDSRDEENVDL